MQKCGDLGPQPNAILRLKRRLPKRQITSLEKPPKVSKSIARSRTRISVLLKPTPIYREREGTIAECPNRKYTQVVSKKTSF